MKKFFSILLFFCSFISIFAYNYDNSVIVLNKYYINKENTFYLDKSCVIFGKEYRVLFSNIQLSPEWFTCHILIEAWTENDYTITQYCSDEDFGPGESGRVSSLSWHMDNGYDLDITSWVHLQEHADEPRETEIVYTIVSNSNGDKFDLILRFPYEGDTITGIDEVYKDSNTIYYNLNGYSSNTPFEGINIVKKNNRVSLHLY